MSRHPALKIPLHVLIQVYQETDLGWKWRCRFEGCRGSSIRVDRDSAMEAGAEHWRREHGATGGKTKNDN